MLKYFLELGGRFVSHSGFKVYLSTKIVGPKPRHNSKFKASGRLQPR